jgi:hypothetical protein
MKLDLVIPFVLIVLGSATISVLVSAYCLRGQYRRVG